MNDLRLDVRWAVRSLAGARAQTLVVVAILSAAIAAASVLGALFMAAVHDVPPVIAPEGVGHVWFADATTPSGHRPASIADFESWKTGSRTLTDLTAMAESRAILGDVDGAAVSALSVSPSYFRATGRPPWIGRAFTADDAQDPDVVIISERLWRERFNGAGDIIGRRMMIDAAPHTIVGVLPAGFWFPFRRIDVWRPLTRDPRTTVDIVGRLEPGRGWADVEAEFNVLAGSRTLVRSLEQEGLIKVGPSLASLMGPAIVILLIACANAGNLLFMRMLAREREFAIRAALGASASRLARLSAVEASLVCAASGAVGAVFATWGMHALQLAANAVPAFGAVRADWFVVALSGAATLTTVPGIAPMAAFRAARWNIHAGFSDGLRRPVMGRFQYGVGDVLIVLQVALGAVLVVVSVFNVRLFAEAVRVSQPADGDRVRVAELTAARSIAADTRPALFADVLDAIRGTGGIEAVALATGLPELVRPRSSLTFAAVGKETSCSIKVAYVSDEFFSALGLRFLKGKVESGPAAIVSASAASRCFEERADRELQVHVPAGSGLSDRRIPVSGVVVDPFMSRMPGTDVMASYAWIVGAREWPAQVSVVVRASTGPKAAAMQPVDGVVLDAFTPMADRIGPGNASTRLILTVYGSGAALALLLAFLGVHAAMSLSCERRMRELGIRLALGAPPRRLVSIALVHDAPLVVVGLVVGLAGTGWVTMIVWRDLLIFNAIDVRVWASIGAVLAGAALLASLGPALHAVRVDPIALLHTE